MNEKNYDLVPIFNEETKSFGIKDFDKVNQACDEFIAQELSQLDLETHDEMTYKNAKKSRTSIRKTQEQIKDVRITCNELAMGNFNKEAKELETKLQEADAKLKAYVDSYDKEMKNKEAKPLKITLTIKGYDMKKIEKVKAYAIKQDLEVSIKE